MSEELDLASHQDKGAIRLGILLDMRAMPQAVNYLHGAIQLHIERKVASGAGQIFEEGPVYLQSPHRTSDLGPINRACLYMMDFGDPAQGNCARMHVHPLGERLLMICPISDFRIWSLTPFEFHQDLVPLLRYLDTYVCDKSGRNIHGVEVPACILVTAQIPAGTSHRFLGRATALSVHPNETDELESVGFTSSSMDGQTKFWAPPTSIECSYSDVTNVNQLSFDVLTSGSVRCAQLVEDIDLLSVERGS